MSDHEKLRLDIWLHRARLYKSRSQATTACREGKIMIGERFADASNPIHVGDTIKIRVRGLYRSYIVREAADVNLSKQDAKRMYDDTTSPETLEKFRQVELASKDWRVGAKREAGPRPTKKARRVVDKLKGR